MSGATSRSVSYHAAKFQQSGGKLQALNSILSLLPEKEIRWHKIKVTTWQSVGSALFNQFLWKKLDPRNSAQTAK
jgi:hypothetical protein